MKLLIYKFTDRPTAYWNKKESETYNNDWATAGLQYWLNAGSDKETNTPSDGYMSYLSVNAKKMIKDTKYYLGAVTTPLSNTIHVIDTPKQAYFNERTINGCDNNKGPVENNNNMTLEKNAACRVWKNNFSNWEGKVGLLYVSDYGYSYLSNNWLNSVDTFGQENIKMTSWMNMNTSDPSWFLSPTIYANYTVAIWNTAIVDNRGVSYPRGALVRPTLYLKSNVKITSGDGTQGNAYKLSLD